MTKALNITLIILAVLLIAIFYRSTNSNQLAQIGDSAGAIPSVSQTGASVARSELQAVAYNNFIHFFGDEKAQKDFALIEPVAGFKQAITKKPFGIFITPETSPVQPDKFTGYHTGVDSEFTDNQEEIPVRAIADGTIVFSSWASGYGGVIVIRHVIEGLPLFALYGHLDPASLLPNQTQVKAGDRIGSLGDDHSQETDGARKHLHFSIYTGGKVDLRGYVQTKEELSSWLNPLDLY